MVVAAARHRYQIVDELNADWQRLVASTGVPEFAGRHPVLRCADLDAVLGAIRSEPDAVLGALLLEATAGSTLAGRVVVQAMLGKLVRMAQAQPGIGVDDFVAALWCRIRGYPLDRRPRRIAANLALDTLKDVLVDARRARLETSMPWPPGEHLDHLMPARVVSDGSADVSAPAVLHAAARLGLIDPPTRAVLQSVYVDGLTSGRAGARHGITADLVRYRCSRAVRRMTAHAEELLDAA